MLQRLNHRGGHCLLLLAVWAAVCLPNLGGPALWDIDEGNNAECFREMRDSGNWIVPTFNYRLREDKPALLYWLQIASAAIVGVNEWAARLPSALAALLCVLVVYELGRRMFDTATALLAGMVLATSIGFVGAAHFANPDALLVAFGTLTLALFWHDWRSLGNGSMAALGAACGLAVLAKGPVGLLLPGGVMVLFLAWQRQWRRLGEPRIVWAVVAFLLVAVPWYVWVAAETKGAWLAGFWNKHHAQRVTSVLEQHGGPFYYYLLVLLAGLAPWSIFVGPVAWHAWKRLKEDAPERAAVRLLLVWFLVYVVCFSAARTKLPNYVLPAYPPAALLTAHYLRRWWLGEVVVPAWLTRVSLVSLALLGVGVATGLAAAGGAVALPALRGRAFPDLAVWAWAGLVPAATAAVASWLLDRGRRGGALAALAVGAVLFVAPLAGGAVAALDAGKASRPLARALPADHLRREVRLGAYRYFQPSLVFYCRREVTRLQRDHEAAGLLLGPRPAYLFVPADDWRRLRPLAPQARIVAGHADLYSGRRVVVVTNEPIQRIADCRLQIAD